VKRKVLSVLLLFFLSQAVFSHAGYELFYIYNYSSDDVMISVKFIMDENTEVTSTGKINIPYHGYTGLVYKGWITYTSGVMLRLFSYYYDISNLKLSPGTKIQMCHYLRIRVLNQYKKPTGWFYPVDTISFMEKMSAIFDDLIIENANGRVLVSMGNLWKQNIYKSDGFLVGYALVILNEGADFDGIIDGYQYEKKPAWEW